MSISIQKGPVILSVIFTANSSVSGKTPLGKRVCDEELLPQEGARL